MRAIVLTYNKRLSIAKLVISCYEKQWKDHPFDFIVPINRRNNSRLFSNMKNVYTVRTAPDIKRTMKRLLQGVPNDEFVYWCTDDRYADKIFDLNIIKKIYSIVESRKFEFDSMRFMKIPRKAAHKGLPGNMPCDVKIGGREFYIYRGNLAWGFWHHQFIKAGVLKRIFLCKQLPQNYSARTVGHFILKNSEMFRHTIYVPQNP